MGNYISEKTRLSMMNRVSSMLLAIAAVLFCSASAIAETFEVDGLYYSVIYGEKNNVEVSRSPVNYGYLGDIVIPATVTHEGTEYNVVSMENSFCATNKYLTSVSIPGSITRIPENAFNSCRMLQSVIIGEGITEIGYGAFAECNYLSSIKLPPSLLCIEKEAFMGCEILADIEFPENLERIGNKAFYYTAWKESLPVGEVYVAKVFYKYNDSSIVTSLDIKEGTVGIAGGALANKYDLKSVTIPASVRNIEDEAFSLCELSDIKFGAIDSIEYVGNNAFNGTKWQESFTEDAIYIGKILYNYKSYCQNVDAVVREGTEIISPGAFNYCSNLKSVTVPASVKYIGYGNFNECEALESVTFAEGSKLRELEHICFANCPSLKKVELPEGLELIGSHCIYGTGITSISLPSTLRGLDPNLDLGANMSLKEFTVPDSSRYFCTIDSVLFTADKKELIACPAMKTGDYVIPDGVEIINNLSFMGSNLSSVTIPASVKYIGFQAFTDTPNLKEVEIKTPSNLKSIGVYAFIMSGLQSINIPEGCETIEDGAFAFCMNLSDITFPKTLKVIESSRSEHYFDSFVGSPWYEAQPDGVVYTGNLAYRIKGQTPSEIVFKESTTAIGDCFCIGDTTVTSVTLPDSLKYIGSSAFEGATKLAKVTNISDSLYANYSFKGTPWFNSHPDGFVNLGKNVVGVKTDGSYVAHFEVDEGIENISLCSYGASLGIKEITLPKSTKVMTDRCFIGYNYLSYLNIKATVPPVFDRHPTVDPQIYYRCVLKVPAGSLDAYKKAPFWNLFRKIEGETTGIEAVGTAESNIRVFADGSNIVVEGVVEGTPVEVFNLNGQRIYSGVETLISVPERGIYIVRVEGKAYKVAM